MSRSSGPWLCIALVAVGFVLASTFLPPPDPNSPQPPSRSPFGGRSGRGGRYSTLGNGTQQQRSPFPMGRGAGRGMFPFFQPPPPPPRQQQPQQSGSNAQSNVEEEEDAVEVDEQQGQGQQAPQQPQQQPHPAPEPQPQSQPPQGEVWSGVAEPQSSSASSTGESMEEEVVKEIPTVLLAFLYGGIGSSLLVLMCCRLYSWCCAPDSTYSPILAYYPPASDTSPLISPLSLYHYQHQSQSQSQSQYPYQPKPVPSSTATTASTSSHRFTPPAPSGGASGRTTSPLAMSLPSAHSCYASMGAGELQGGAGKGQGWAAWGERGDEKDEAVWAYSV